MTRSRPRAGAAGQGFVEFGIMLALAVLIAVAVLVLLRPQLAWVLSMIGSEVDKSGWLVPGLALAWGDHDATRTNRLLDRAAWSA